MSYILSICIPSYNRADMLSAAIESILNQAAEGVEIVVSDNASTDNTDLVMRDLAQRHPQIRYVRSDVNVGADRNFLKVVELAAGRYTWLMGSDDMVAPGGVAEVLSAIESHPELPGFSVNRQMYDVSMSRPQNDLDIFPPQAQRVHAHDSAQSAIHELGIYLSFISGQVFNRETWRRYANHANIDKYFNGLVHLFPLFALIRDADTWGAIAAPIVQCRGDNDSFLSAGHFKRFEIDVIGFSRAASDVFGRSHPIYRQLMSNVLRSLLVNRIIGFKLSRVRGIYLQCFATALPVCWRFARFWSVFVPALLLPPSLLHQVLGLRRSGKPHPTINHLES
jgi:abequosyltransferase